MEWKRAWSNGLTGVPRWGWPWSGLCGFLDRSGLRGLPERSGRHTAAARCVPLPDPRSKIVPVEEGLFQSNRIVPVPVAQWLEHCISKHKGCGFDSQGTIILTIQMYSLNAL